MVALNILAYAPAWRNIPQMQACVGDTSPLIALSSVGHLDLLRVEFNEVLIVPAVFNEVITQGDGWRQAAQLQAEIARATWIRRCPAAGTDLERHLRDELGGSGESEAIAAAAKRGLTVFLDELRGRRAARRQGVAVMGSLGVLHRAKSAGRISEIRPVVAAMLAEGIYYDYSLLTSYFQQIGE